MKHRQLFPIPFRGETTQNQRLSPRRSGVLNIHLLCQANLLDGWVPELTNAHSYRHSMIGNLTWEGNEFIDAARKSTIWERTKTYVASKGLEMTFEIAKEALKTVTLQSLKGDGP